MGFNFGGLTLKFHRRFRKNGIWTPNRRNARPLEPHAHAALGITRHSRNWQQYLHIICGSGQYRSLFARPLFSCTLKEIWWLHGGELDPDQWFDETTVSTMSHLSGNRRLMTWLNAWRT